MKKLQKFIPFVKVDEAKREVWGIVTAEVPDKDGETCRYAPTVRNYKAWVSEFQKATDGDSFGNLREMHQLKAAGRGVGIEYRDEDKEIWMGFKVVDDAAWNKVVEKVYTGYSQGGEYVDGPDRDGFYTAKPTEVSLVDSPCLGVAHFAFIRSTGAIELVKIRSVEKEASKTKRVAGEDLTAADFAFAGDPEKPETWKLPIKFSTTEKTASHVRNALARFEQTEGIPAGEKARVKSTIVAAARAHGITVTGEKAMDKTEVLELIEQALAKAAVNKGAALAKAGLHGHMTKALDHHAKAMEHLVAAKRAAEDGDEAGPHIEKAHKAMEMCGKCMGKAMEAMGHEVDSEGIQGGAEEGEKNAEKARKSFEAAGLKGAALEKAMETFTGKAAPVTAETIGEIVEGKLAAMLKTLFGGKDKEDDSDDDDETQGADKTIHKVKVQQTSRRVTKTEDNADVLAELDKLREEVKTLKKGTERVHDPETALAELAKNRGEVLTPEKAMSLGIVK